MKMLKKKGRKQTKMENDPLVINWAITPKVSNTKSFSQILAFFFDI
jgi:hypothetical protein